MQVQHDHKAVVSALAFSPDGGMLASGSRDGALLVGEPGAPPTPLLDAGPKQPAVNAVAFLPDGALVIAHAHGWHIHRPAAGTWKMVTPPTVAPTTAVAVVSPTLLAIGTGDRNKPTVAGALELWDLKAERRMEPFFREPNGVRTVAACPKKGLVAWATGHMKVTIWDIRRQSPVHFPTTHTSSSVSISPDGALLAAAVDWSAKVFDVARKQERATLKGHKGQVSAVAFSPDGRTLATGSWDQTIRLWDVESGQERAAFKWPVGKIYSLTYSPDGLRLAAGGDVGAVVVWDTE